MKRDILPTLNKNVEVQVVREKRVKLTILRINKLYYN